MDIFEFTQALWRQRKMLLIGFVVLLVGVLALVFEVGEDGIQQRVTPKYEAQSRMAVVPAELESFTDMTGVADFSNIAELYAELLRAPEASIEIQQDQEVVFVEPMEVASPTRTSFINVVVTSDTPESAKRGALGAFSWLEERLIQPPSLADIPVETLDVTDILDNEGKFLGQIRLSIARQFAVDELFLVLTNSLGDDMVVPLSEVVGVTVQQAYLVPGSELEIGVEDATGVRHATTTFALPAFPEGPISEVPSLALEFNAGAIRVEPTGSTDDAETDEPGETAQIELNPARISAAWDTVPILEQVSPLTLLLITEDPVPALTGQRRTPVIAAAGLGVGFLVLLVVAVTVDTWQQAYAERGRRRYIPDGEWLEEVRPESDETEETPDDREVSENASVRLSDGTVTHFRHRGEVDHGAQEIAENELGER